MKLKSLHGCGALGAALLLLVSPSAAQKPDIDLSEYIEVKPDTTLRELATSIKERFGERDLLRFEIWLGSGYDVRNGKDVSLELLERHLVVEHPRMQDRGELKGAIAEFPMKAMLSFRAVGGAVRHAPFQLHSQYRVDRVLQDGLMLGTERLGSAVSVTLPRPLAEGQVGSIELHYTARIDRTRDPRTPEERAFYGRSSFIWARSSVAWYPTLRGQSSRGSLRIAVGRAWRALGPGRIVDDTPQSEEGEVEFILDEPGDPFFVVGDLAKLQRRAGDRLLEWIGPHELAALGRHTLEIAAEALAWIEAQGLPVPWYGVESWEMLWCTPGFVPGPDQVAALLGRTWWWTYGNLRTTLDEALWVYLGRRFAIDKGWRDNRGDWWTCGESGEYYRALQRHGGKMESLRTVLRGKAEDPLFAALVRAGKGALFLHALEHEIGLRKLMMGLRDLGHRREEARLMTVEHTVKKELAKVDGDELDAFLEAWLDGEEVPAYDIAGARAREEGGEWSLELDLLAGNHPLGLDVELEVTTAGKRERHRISPREREERFRIRTSARPLRVELDPDMVLLRDPRSMKLPFGREELAGFMAYAPSVHVIYPERGGAAGPAAARKAAEELLEHLKRAAPQADLARAISDREALRAGLPREGVRFILGGPEENLLLRELRSELAFTLEPHELRLGERCISGLAEPELMCYWSSEDGKLLSVVWTAATPDLPRADHQFVLRDGGVVILEGFLAPRGRIVAVVQ